MALKIGKLEIGLRLLVSFISISVAYAYLGGYLSTLLNSLNYPIAVLLFALAVAGVFAIPKSLGGLLAAIVSVIVVYWQSNITYSLVTLGICLVLYWLGFSDIVYNPEPDKKLSSVEILSTIITIALTIAITFPVFQFHPSWLASIEIGFFAATITLIGKQIKYLELPPTKNLIILGILTTGSLAIGFVIRAVSYMHKQTGFS